MTQRTLVTGGAGVIGRALLERLVAAGSEVRCVDLQPVPGWLPPEVDYIQGDLQILDLSFLTSYEPEVVFHLAATFERSEESAGFWLESADHNVTASRRVLEAIARSSSVRRVVFASSYLVYDPSLYLLDRPPVGVRPLEEGSPLRPRNVCGVAKLLHEYELEQAAASGDHRFTFASARIFRVYGRGSRDIVSRWIRSSLTGNAIEVFGDESLFDYVYADDVAEGLVRIAESDIQGPVNLGSGAAHRVRDVVDAITDVLGGVEAVSGPRATAFEASEADISRLRRATGWIPQTDLVAGVEALVAHERVAPIAERRRVTARPPQRVLLTSSARKTPMLRAFREAIRSLALEGEVWAGDMNDLAATRFEADGFWPMPRIADVDDDELAESVVSHGITVLVPTRDGELERFAALRERLADAGVFVAVSDPDAVRSCDDKVQFAAILKRAGIPTIETSVAAPATEGTYVVKERRGSGSRSLAIGLDAAGAAAYARSLREPIFQPLIEGTEYSIDVYVTRNGVGHGAIARRRDIVVDGESQVTTIVRDEGIEAAALRAATVLGIRGHAVVQAILASELLMLECNARIGGASTASFAAGLRTPQYVLQEATGESPTPLRRPNASVRLVRSPSDRIQFD